MFSSKIGATWLALVVILGLVIFKFLIAFLTGSISIFAQAFDSFLDIVVVLIAFFSIRVSIKPADEEHPFGHGKIENISAVAQAILIFTAGGLIIFSAINRIISKEDIELTEMGIGIMAVSIIVSILLSRHLLKVSRATDSLALEAIGQNITADVISAFGVLSGLIIIHFTGLTILDPIIALIVSIIILKSAYNIIIKSSHGLMDGRLPKTEEKKIASCLQ